MKRLLDFAGEGQRLGRSLFIAATVDAPLDPAAVDALARALADVRGVDEVLAATGEAIDLGALEAPKRAIVLVAWLLEHRGARDVGREFAAATSGAFGVASSVDGDGAAPEALIAVSLEGAPVASTTASRSGGFVHTELYAVIGSVGTYTFEERAFEPELIPPARSGAYGPNGRADGGASLVAEAPTDPGARSEFDDPFAFIDTNDSVLTPARARTLTDGIAPPHQILLAEERAQTALVEQLTKELEALRAERDAALRRATSGAPESLYERRIDKLVRQLDEAESEIARLRIELDSDPGVPSEYRQVQGLAADAPEVKRELIEGVFLQNVDRGRGSQEKAS